VSAAPHAELGPVETLRIFITSPLAPVYPARLEFDDQVDLYDVIRMKPSLPAKMRDGQAHDLALHDVSRHVRRRYPGLSA
jgi:hypothetical protein